VDSGLLLIVVGLGVAVVGVLVWAGGLGWFGRLPGDLRLEGAGPAGAGAADLDDRRLGGAHGRAQPGAALVA
jgi:hypothetical protein